MFKNYFFNETKWRINSIKIRFKNHFEDKFVRVILANAILNSKWNIKRTSSSSPIFLGSKNLNSKAIKSYVLEKINLKHILEWLVLWFLNGHVSRIKILKFLKNYSLKRILKNKDGRRKIEIAKRKPISKKIFFWILSNARSSQWAHQSRKNKPIFHSNFLGVIFKIWFIQSQN